MKKPLSAELAVRIKQLPGKVATVLTALYALDHIDDSILTTVLDAGDLAAETSRLASFAVSYLALKQKGIPIGDVIAMAKQHSRKINLWWSPARWHDEHQRLSRLVTLKRLASANTQYSLERFSRDLPNCFNGYLIKSSRRLGMEGLQQRHCVASWHDRILSGRYAIAVVFVNHTRWTVELCATDNSNNPLTIGQIKTRLNKEADQETKKQIYAALKIEMPHRAIWVDEAATEQYRQLYLHNCATLVPILRQLGVEKVIVTFSGEGDSGQIDDVDVVPSLTSPPVVDLVVKRIAYNHGVNQVSLETIQRPLLVALKYVVEDYLEWTGVNWYDNDGGYGEFVLDIEKDLMSMEVFQRYTESTCEFSDDMDLEALVDCRLPVALLQPALPETS